MENTWAISLDQLVTEFNHLLVEEKRPRDPLELPSSRYNTRISMERVFKLTKFMYSKVITKLEPRLVLCPFS